MPPTRVTPTALDALVASGILARDAWIVAATRKAAPFSAGSPETGLAELLAGGVVYRSGRGRVLPTPAWERLLGVLAAPEGLLEVTETVGPTLRQRDLYALRSDDAVAFALEPPGLVVHQLLPLRHLVGRLQHRLRFDPPVPSEARFCYYPSCLAVALEVTARLGPEPGRPIPVADVESLLRSRNAAEERLPSLLSDLVDLGLFQRHRHGLVLNPAYTTWLQILRGGEALELSGLAGATPAEPQPATPKLRFVGGEGRRCWLDTPAIDELPARLRKTPEPPRMVAILPGDRLEELIRHLLDRLRPTTVGLRHAIYEEVRRSPYLNPPAPEVSGPTPRQVRDGGAAIQCAGVARQGLSFDYLGLGSLAPVWRRSGSTDGGGAGATAGREAELFVRWSRAGADDDTWVRWQSRPFGDPRLVFSIAAPGSWEWAPVTTELERSTEHLVPLARLVDRDDPRRRAQVLYLLQAEETALEDWVSFYFRKSGFQLLARRPVRHPRLGPGVECLARLRRWEEPVELARLMFLGDGRRLWLVAGLAPEASFRAKPRCWAGIVESLEVTRPERVPVVGGIHCTGTPSPPLTVYYPGGWTCTAGGDSAVFERCPSGSMAGQIRLWSSRKEHDDPKALVRSYAEQAAAQLPEAGRADARLTVERLISEHFEPPGAEARLVMVGPHGSPAGELRVACLQSARHWHLLTLLGPARQRHEPNWMINHRALQLMVALLRLETVKQPQPVS